MYYIPNSLSKLPHKGSGLFHPLAILSIVKHPLPQRPPRHLPRLTPSPNSSVQIRPKRHKLRHLTPQRLLLQDSQHLLPQPVESLLGARRAEIAEGAEDRLDAGLVGVGCGGCGGVGADGAGAGEATAGEELLAVFGVEVLGDIYCLVRLCHGMVAWEGRTGYGYLFA